MNKKSIAYIVAAVIVAVVAVVLICVSCGNLGTKNQDVIPSEPEPTEQEAFPDDNKTEWVVVESDATWEGYGDLPFDEFLKKGIPAVYSETYEVKKCAVIAHEGWNAEGLLDESTLASGSKAVTFVADTVMVIDGAETVVGLKFYMELTSQNTLKAVASETYRSDMGWGDVLYEDDTKALLEELKAVM